MTQLINDTGRGDAISTLQRIHERYGGSAKARGVSVSAGGGDEHALQHFVLRGRVRINSSRGRLTNLPRKNEVDSGAEFPARWPASSRRYIDVVMRGEGAPWAVELKTAHHPRAEFSKGIAQASLAAAYIRSATALKPWFARQQLDSALTRGALVVPRTKTNEDRAQYWGSAAAALGVEIILVDIRVR